MKIMPIQNDKHNVVVKANTKPIKSILKSTNLPEVYANKETGTLFKGLVALAGTALAEFALFAEQDKDTKTFLNNVLQEFGLDNISDVNQKISNFFPDIFRAKDNNNDKEIDLVKLIQEKPERELYLKITSYFPNLDKEYKQMLAKSYLEPENEANNNTIGIIENTFNLLSSDGKLNLTKNYFSSLNDNYSDCLDAVAANLSSTIINGKSPMYYLVLLNNGKLTSEDVKKWAKAKNLSCDEFMVLKKLDENQLSKLSNVKEKYQNKFILTDFQPMKEYKNVPSFAFKLNFDEHLPLKKKLEIISGVHEAIYGPIIFAENKDYLSEHLENDIQTEMIDNVVKDRMVDSTYTLVKYLSPKSLKRYNFSVQDIKFMDKNSKEYKEIKNICQRELVNLDKNNPKFKELCSVINDNSLYGNLFVTNHSKMRFLTRFVLKDNTNPKKLSEECALKLQNLRSELGQILDSCNYFAYVHPKGLAPQFYVRDSKLGNYLKITLNASGSIHTIYEDINKELRDKNS